MIYGLGWSPKTKRDKESSLTVKKRCDLNLGPFVPG